MNHPNMIVWCMMSDLYELSEMPTSKLILHSLMSAKALINNQFVFPKEMIGQLLNNIYEFIYESSGYLSIEIAFLADTEDESLKEIAREFISTIKLDSQNGQNFYNFITVFENRPSIHCLSRILAVFVFISKKS